MKTVHKYVSGGRVFVCDVEPLGDGGWEVWISEVPYRGASTDGVCGELGERRRIGEAYTRRWLVGNRRLTITARMLAERSVKKAEKLAACSDAADERWRANAQRSAFRVTIAEPTNPDPQPTTEDA